MPALSRNCCSDDVLLVFHPPFCLGTPQVLADLVSRRIDLQNHYHIAIFGCLLAGACGCSTFSQQAVDSNVVRCRQQCQAGLEAARRGKDESALDTFAAACESCPIDERARRLYAESLWNQGKQKEAMTQMAEAQRLSGGEPETTVRLGQMYLDSGEIDRARSEAARAIVAAPRSAEAWALEGDVLHRSGEFDAALARYHRALSYRSDFPEVQFAVAEIYAQQGRHARALATLGALSMQYEPQRVPQQLHIMRGRSCASLGRHGEAASEFSQAVRAAPPTPELLYELATALAASGDTIAARLTAEQALSLQPEHADSQKLLAQLGGNRPAPYRRYH